MTWTIVENGRSTTVSCPLCGNIVRTTYEAKLSAHFGRELSVMGYRSLACKASLHTPAEARELARREAAELDALRLRAHP